MFTLVHQFCIFHLFFCVYIINVCQDQSPVDVFASIGINKLLVNNPVSCTFMPMHHNSHNSLAWSCCLGIVAHLQAMHKLLTLPPSWIVCSSKRLCAFICKLRQLCIACITFFLRITAYRHCKISHVEHCQRQHTATIQFVSPGGNSVLRMHIEEAYVERCTARGLF